MVTPRKTRSAKSVKARQRSTAASATAPVNVAPKPVSATPVKTMVTAPAVATKAPVAAKSSVATKVSAPVKPAVAKKPVVAPKSAVSKIPAMPKTVAEVAPKAAAAVPVKAEPLKDVAAKSTAIAEQMIAPAKKVMAAVAKAAEPVTKLATSVAAQVEWPLAKAAQAEPTPQISISEMADLIPSPVAGAAANMKGEKIMTNVIETAKNYAEEAKTHMQSAFSDMSQKTKSAVEKSGKAFEEMGDIAKGNLEAMVESSKIAAKGVESMGQDAAEFGRTSFEKTSATMKSFAAIKSPVEFFQLQSEMMSQFMDSMASQSAKNSEKMLKLVGEISQPISNRVSVVTDKMKSLAA